MSELNRSSARHDRGPAGSSAACRLTLSAALGSSRLSGGYSRLPLGYLSAASRLPLHTSAAPRKFGKFRLLSATLGSSRQLSATLGNSRLLSPRQRPTGALATCLCRRSETQRSGGRRRRVRRAAGRAAATEVAEARCAAAEEREDAAARATRAARAGTRAARAAQAATGSTRLRGEYADVRTGRRYCAVHSRRRVSTRAASTVQLITCLASAGWDTDF